MEDNKREFLERWENDDIFKHYCRRCEKETDTEIEVYDFDNLEKGDVYHCLECDGVFRLCEDF